MTRDAAFKKQVRARMAKTGEAYTTARAQLLQRNGRSGSESVDATLHVTNGDSAAMSLRETGIAGAVLPWRDALHVGPVPGDMSESQLRAVRARYIAGQWGLDEPQVLADLTERDRTLHGNHEGEYVLWFEADLYDQLQLIQVLAMLEEMQVDPARVSLVSIGEYPDFAHFGGLGELRPDQLTQLFPRREYLDRETLRLGAEAWRAFRSDNPRSLTDLDRWSSRRLRFLAEAFSRLAEEYPWRSDGLSLTQRRILATVADGPLSMFDVFRRVWRKERRPFLGDTVCFDTIDELASGSPPLLAYRDRERSDSPKVGLIVLTDAGRNVLSGESHYLGSDTVERWIGGVHLRPGARGWQYDERREVLVAAEAT